MLGGELAAGGRVCMRGKRELRGRGRGGGEGGVIRAADRGYPPADKKMGEADKRAAGAGARNA